MSDAEAEIRRQIADAVRRGDADEADRLVGVLTSGRPSTVAADAVVPVAAPEPLAPVVVLEVEDVVVTDQAVVTPGGTYAAKSISGVTVEPLGGALAVMLAISFTLFFAIVFFPCAFVTFLSIFVFAANSNRHSVKINVSGSKVVVLGSTHKDTAEQLRSAIESIL